MKLFLIAAALVAMTLVSHAEEKIPFGAWDYCQRNAADELCGDAKIELRVDYTAERQTELESVDNHFNHSIFYETDKAQWNVPEHWDNPTNNKGDCEDYAIAKMKNLIGKGWPLASFDIGSVLLPDHTFHAVLIIHTTQGELISDYFSGEIVKLEDYKQRIIKESAGSFLHWRLPLAVS